MHRFSVPLKDGPDWGPLMSRWSFAERQVRVTDGVEKTIVFIGRAAPTGQFVPYGTGFLAAVTHADDNMVYQSIVTARHVIDSIAGTDEILIRINTHSGDARTVRTERRGWFSFDHNVDLAFHPGLVAPEIFDILHVPVHLSLTEEIISEKKIGLGEDVFVCGMYLSRIGENRNLPIIRAGVLSAMPSEMVRTEYGYHHVYLIEARSTAGLSGSPVFLQLPPIRFVNENVTTSAGSYPQYFVGMVLGINKLSYPAELIQFLPPEMKDDAERQEDERERSIPLNTGIAIVLPASYIQDALLHPEVIVMRKEAAERARKRSGYISTGVISVVGGATVEKPNPGDQNPDHREDFNRLVTAASRPRPKGGQT